MPAVSFIWKVVIFAVVVILFFPQLAKIFRVLMGQDGKSSENARGRATDEPRPAATVRCHKCGARLPPDARYCPKCGCTQDIIDV